MLICLEIFLTMLTDERKSVMMNLSHPSFALRLNGINENRKGTTKLIAEDGSKKMNVCVVAAIVVKGKKK